MATMVYHLLVCSGAARLRVAVQRKRLPRWPGRIFRCLPAAARQGILDIGQQWIHEMLDLGVSSCVAKSAAHALWATASSHIGKANVARQCPAPGLPARLR
eukprot:3789203-Pyramimonas_sp.AAC.1